MTRDTLNTYQKTALLLEGATLWQAALASPLHGLEASAWNIFVRNNGGHDAPTVVAARALRDAAFDAALDLRDADTALGLPEGKFA